MTVLSESIADTHFLETVFATVIRVLGQPSALAVGVESVTRNEIQAINLAQRNIDRVTDVLSFPTQNLKIGEILIVSDHPQDVDPELNELYLGDIALCEEVACEQATEYGHSVERETGYLFCHALFHLFGYDHIEESDRKIMREKEDAVMTKLNLKRETD